MQDDLLQTDRAFELTRPYEGLTRAVYVLRHEAGRAWSLVHPNGCDYAFGADELHEMIAAGVLKRNRAAAHVETALCSCNECQTLDALPLRRQGIPGARQLLLVALDQSAAPSIAALTSSARPQRGLEGLGLFDPGHAAVNQLALF